MACLCLAAAAVGYVVWYGDPLGGMPHVRVDIAARTAPPVSTPLSDAAATARPPGAPESDRSSADAVESASGVSVIRGDGSGAPTSVIVRVPDAPSDKLKAAPDPRLVERTRFGPLPRIGQDGSRALEVYARPAGQLPGAVRPTARIAIVVGGLGISQTATADALTKLPAAVTLAFAPYGQDLDAMANRARAAGHEIMLQIPMEPFDYPDSDPGPHTLTTTNKPTENIDHLQWAMGRLTGYVGLMNYMGGKLTSDETALAPILKEAAGRGLAILDDGSSSRPFAANPAGPAKLARSALVVDAASRGDLIDKALERLEAAAVAGGFALGTASALPVSIERIGRWARGLEERGILLVPASYAFRPKAAGTAGR